MSVFVNEVHGLSLGKLIRWKIFQVLELQGENAGPGAKRDVKDLLITSEQFSSYLSRAHAGLIMPALQSIVKAEPNDIMRASYIIIDEYGRLLDASQGGKTPTQSILEVGVQGAMKQLVGMMHVGSQSSPAATAAGERAEPAAKQWRLSQTKGFDPASFYERDGFYPDKWSREATVA